MPNAPAAKPAKKRKPAKPPKSAAAYYYCHHLGCLKRFIQLYNNKDPDLKDIVCPNVGKIEGAHPLQRVVLGEVNSHGIWRLDVKAANTNESKPFAGVILQPGDTDEGPRYAGLDPSTPSDDDVKKAEEDKSLVRGGVFLVREMKRDLLRLGYYSPSRVRGPGRHDGHERFSMHVAGSLLAFKAFLLRPRNEGGLGLESESSFDDLEAPKAPAADGSGFEPGKIYYRKLLNPLLLFNRVTEWGAILLGPKGKPSLPEQCMKALEPVEVSFDPLTAELGPVRVRYDDALVAAARVPTELDDRLLLDVALRSPSFNAADRTRHAQARTKVAAQLKTINARAALVKGLFESARTILTDLEAELTVRVDALRDVDDDSEVADAITARWKVVVATERSGEAERRTKKLEPQRKAALVAWRGWLERGSAIDRFFMALRGAYARCFLHLNGLSDSPIEEWIDRAHRRVRSAFDELVKRSEELADVGRLYQHYRSELREYARLDETTAWCLRLLAARGELLGLRVFRIPQDAEIQHAVVGLSAPGAIIGQSDLSAVLEGMGRNKQAFPYPIFQHIINNESSNSVVFGDADVPGSTFFIFGVDWDNFEPPDGTGSTRLWFDEFVTIPGAWISSIGYFGGFTPGNGEFADAYWVRSKDGPHVFERKDDKPFTFKYKLGWPRLDLMPTEVQSRVLGPASLVSGRDALKRVVKIFLDFFSYSAERRDCTYCMPYDCRTCLSRFRPFDFERVITTRARDGQSWETTRLGSSGWLAGVLGDGMREMLARNYRACRSGLIGGIPGLPVLATPFDDSPDGIEMPCSWLSARQHFAGSGPEAMRHVTKLVADRARVK